MAVEAGRRAFMSQKVILANKEEEFSRFSSEMSDRALRSQADNEVMMRVLALQQKNAKIQAKVAHARHIQGEELNTRARQHQVHKEGCFEWPHQGLHVGACSEFANIKVF